MTCPRKVLLRRRGPPFGRNVGQCLHQPVHQNAARQRGAPLARGGWRQARDTSGIRILAIGAGRRHKDDLRGFFLRVALQPIGQVDRGRFGGLRI